jgi:hypothetical protein
MKKIIFAIFCITLFSTTPLFASTILVGKGNTANTTTAHSGNGNGNTIFTGNGNIAGSNSGNIQGGNKDVKGSFNTTVKDNGNNSGNDSGNTAASNTVVPQILPGLNNGSIGEYTAQLYHFSNPALTPLSRTDQITKILHVYSGHWYSKITLEDLEEFLLSNAEQFNNTTNVRFTVYFKGRITGGGANLGGGGAMSSVTGSTSGGGQAGAGYFSSTFDPIFIVTFYEVADVLKVQK